MSSNFSSLADQPVNIFFVAFEFPPLASGGVQRSLYFVKYLSDYGVSPVVITPETDDLKKIFHHGQVDASLLAEIPPGTAIERVHCEAPKPSGSTVENWFRMFFTVTENFKTYWRPGLEKRLPALLEQYKPAAVYVSIPPFAMVPLWLDILKKSPLPLIIDFRDAWSQWAMAPFGSRFHYQAILRMEKSALSKASAVIVSSEQTKLDLLRVHREIPAEKICVITNGYDGEINVPARLQITKTGKIIIGYVGNFYYAPETRKEIFKPWWKKKPHRMLNYVPRKEDWLYRSPYFFFRSLGRLLEQNPELRERVEVHFAGHRPAWLSEQIRESGLEDICHHAGFLDHDDVILFQRNCDMLLITSSKVIGGRDYSIAGKTFEYFSIGKPILAFVCEGAQKDILEKSGMALICDPDDLSGSADLMKQMIGGQTVLHPSSEFIGRFQRKKLAEKLAGLVKKAAGNGM